MEADPALDHHNSEFPAVSRVCGSTRADLFRSVCAMSRACRLGGATTRGGKGAGIPKPRNPLREEQAIYVRLGGSRPVAHGRAKGAPWITALATCVMCRSPAAMMSRTPARPVVLLRNFKERLLRGPFAQSMAHIDVPTAGRSTSQSSSRCSLFLPVKGPDHSEMTPTAFWTATQEGGAHFGNIARDQRRPCGLSPRYRNDL
jgi:hypothetical protein